jgi:DNA-directed RNA polymerase-3 subunit RPC5
LDARIKPKQNKLEIEVELNTTNDNYSRTKGEQFAVNVDGKPGLIMGNASKQQTSKEQRYYKSNCMDKHVLTSTNATLGQMSRLYQLGILKNNKLHLNPVQSILQMKPSFEYFDIYDRKVKENKDAQHAEMGYLFFLFVFKFLLNFLK